MRHIITALISISAIACQSAQQSDAGSAAGSTTVTRGTPSVTQSETTRVRGDSAAPRSASGDATIALDRSTYAPGATVSARLTSRTSDTLGYNQCSNRSIERQQGTSWVAHPEPNRMCTMELRLLLPNETQTLNLDLPANLTAGTYRVVLTLSRQRSAPPGAPANWGTVRAVSASFRVQ
jgi:hypothetical protein